MEEITFEELEQAPQETQAPALIQVVQPAILKQAITQKSWEIEKKVGMALHLAVSPDTLAEVKNVRADLNKDAAEYAAQFKAAKEQALAPWLEVEAKWNAEIRDKLRKADGQLKEKISAVESGIIGQCVEEMQAHFRECVASAGLDWLTWDRLGIKIGLTEAKKAKHTALKKSVAEQVESIRECVATIGTLDSSSEILVEYKRSLNLAEACQIVANRHQRIEEERKAQEERAAREAAQREAVERVEAAAPAPAPTPAPVPVAAPVAAPAAQKDDTIYVASFAVKGTMGDLKEFKAAVLAYCSTHNIEYVKKGK